MSEVPLYLPTYLPSVLCTYLTNVRCYLPLSSKLGTYKRVRTRIRSWLSAETDTPTYLPIYLQLKVPKILQVVKSSLGSG